MTSITSEAPVVAPTRHRVFAALWERMAGHGFDPLRRDLASRAHGVVLEVGSGTGLNFAFYDPNRVQRVEAVELDTFMLQHAQPRATRAPVPVTLTQAAVEMLPYADATFDTALATVVFCSVDDPARGLREVYRVLKPGGELLLIEHVRSENGLVAGIQDALVPITTRLTGNCRWNRDTARLVAQAGFQTISSRSLFGGLQPVITLTAMRPAA